MFKKIFIFLIFFVCIFSSFNFALAEGEITCEDNGIGSEINCGQSSIFNTTLSNFTLPVIIIAGLIDGINPCAIGMMILLLGYMIVFAKKKEQVLKIGAVYIITIFITYFSIGIIFYKFIGVLVSQPYYRDISKVIEYILGIIIIIAGLINIKDFFWYGKGFSLQIPQSQRMKLTKFVQKASVPATLILGVIVTLFELPCSLPLYVGSISLLYENLGGGHVIVYLFIYNLLFVMPLVIIYILIVLGKRIADLKEWQEKRQKEMKLGMGIILVLLGALFFLIK